MPPRRLTRKAMFTKVGIDRQEIELEITEDHFVLSRLFRVIGMHFTGPSRFMDKNNR